MASKHRDEKVIADTRARENRMTGEAYRKLRERLGLTQPQLAKLLGTTANTIWRREAGQVPITRESEIALRSIENQARPRAPRS